MTTPIRGYCEALHPPNPLSRSGAGTSTLRVYVASPIQLKWADGSTDTYAPDPAGAPSPHAACLSVYSPYAAAVDGSAFVWLVVASHGTANLWLAKEADFGNIPSLLDTATGGTAGEWAPLFRVDGDVITKLDQAIGAGVTVVGTPVKGDMLWYDGTEWALLAPPGSPAGTDRFWVLKFDTTLVEETWADVPDLPDPSANGLLLYADGTSWLTLPLPGSAPPQGFNEGLIWDGSGIANWKTTVTWEQGGTPLSISAVHNNCTGGSIAGGARSGTIALTMSGTIAAGNNVLLADISFGATYAAVPNVLLSPQQFAPHIVYHSADSTTGFSITICNPTGSSTAVSGTLFIAYAVLPS